MPNSLLDALGYLGETLWQGCKQDRGNRSSTRLQ